MIDDVVADYAARRESYGRAADVASRAEGRIGIARLTVFFVGVLVVIATTQSRISVPLGAIVVGLLGAIFVGLVIWQARLQDQSRTLRELQRFCIDGTSRALREWEAIPEGNAPLWVLGSRPLDHAYADDLRVTSTDATAHTLTRLLPRLSRSMGRGVVEDWLLVETPPHVDVLRARQEAVSALVPFAEWRERLSVLSTRVLASERSLTSCLSWCDEVADVPAFGRATQWTAVVLAVVTVLSIIAAVLANLPAGIPILLIAINVMVTGTTRRRAARAMETVAGHEARLRGMGVVLKHASTAPGDAPLLSQLRERLGGGDAARAFDWFDQLTSFAETRFSPMGHAILQALVLWDVHVVAAMERWRARHGASVRTWLTAVGELEAVAAFVTLSYENPRWSFPQIEEESSATLDAEALAHPFLAPPVAVANDVRIGDRGKILFITGSNMAGKSTLLRAIGLNVVLAQAGAPVCASRMRLARVRVRTSIEATDALDRGLSLFMAELVRVKTIVDAACATSDCRLLYIVDEMLRGTNAKDRHTAVAMILDHLIRAGAVGVVATHDAELAADPRLASHLESYHLLEHFRNDGSGPKMWFDYRLRPGLATTTNALALLDAVGLGSRGVD